MYRFFAKQSIVVSPQSIVAPHTVVQDWKVNRIWNQQKITQLCVGYVPIHVGLSVSTVDESENLSTNPVFLETTPSQHLLITLSIFEV